METPNESEEGRMSEVQGRVKNFPGSCQGRFRRDVSGRGSQEPSGQPKAARLEAE